MNCVNNLKNIQEKKVVILLSQKSMKASIFNLISKIIWVFIPIFSEDLGERTHLYIPWERDLFCVNFYLGIKYLLNE